MTSSTLLGPKCPPGQDMVANGRAVEEALWGCYQHLEKAVDFVLVSRLPV